jgi:hypothetical protein
MHIGESGMGRRSAMWGFSSGDLVCVRGGELAAMRGGRGDEVAYHKVNGERLGQTAAKEAFLALSQAAREAMKDTENQLEAVQYQRF